MADTIMPQGDVLMGTKAIADFLGLNVRQVRNLIYDHSGLPTFKLGGSVCARKSTLDKWISKVEKMK